MAGEESWGLRGGVGYEGVTSGLRGAPVCTVSPCVAWRQLPPLSCSLAPFPHTAPVPRFADSALRFRATAALSSSPPYLQTAPVLRFADEEMVDFAGEQVNVACGIAFNRHMQVRLQNVALYYTIVH